MTSNPPWASGTIVASETLPSPHWTVAEKALRCALGLASVNVATTTANAVPSVAANTSGTTVIDASATLAVEPAEAVAPPVSLMVTAIESEPTSM